MGKEVVEQMKEGSGMSETYPARVKCHNCGREFTVSIPKGQTKKEYADTTVCPNCGCKDQLFALPD